MSKKLPVILLAFIFLLGVFFRFYRLGKIPPSLDWDEASLGWNAYSLLTTGSDEYGVTHPVSIRSFNDYKPPVYVYLTVPSVALFGLNEYAVRFPSALLGSLAILATFFLVKELLEFDENGTLHKYRYKLALLTALFLAVSPWHIQFSRASFEANISLFFFIVGGVFLLKALREKNWAIFAAAISYIISIYSYHSSRLVVPLFLAGIVLIYRKRFRGMKFNSLAAAGVCLIMLIPLAVSTFRVGSLQARFDAVSIFSNIGYHDLISNTIDMESEYRNADFALGDRFGKSILHNKNLTFAKLIGKGYLDHFNFEFLFLNGDGNGRQHAPGMGLLYLFEAPFIAAGLFFLIRDRDSATPFLLLWLFLAPAAAALATDTPHAIRSLLFLPTFQIMSGLGIIKFTGLGREIKSGILRYTGVIAWISVTGIFLVSVFYYSHMYFIHTNLEAAPDWQYGYKQVVELLQSKYPQYVKVDVTVTYDQPYIYFLFYGGVNPYEKNPGDFNQGFGRYRFVNFSLLSNVEKNKMAGTDLLVLAPSDPIQNIKVLDKINYPDGKTAFIIATGEKQ